MELRKRFGILVKSYRQRLDMTQADLAAATGMSDTMISRIEVGGSGARFPTIEKLAQALHVDAAELFIADPVPGRNVRSKIVELDVRLAALSDADLDWIIGVVDAALAHRKP